jgi:hypothetical protein
MFLMNKNAIFDGKFQTRVSKGFNLITLSS